LGSHLCAPFFLFLSLSLARLFIRACARNAFSSALSWSAGSNGGDRAAVSRLLTDFCTPPRSHCAGSSVGFGCTDADSCNDTVGGDYNGFGTAVGRDRFGIGPSGRPVVGVSCPFRLDLYCCRGIYHCLVGSCCRILGVDAIVRENPSPVGMKWPRRWYGVGS
jgi:hypothetical protein